MALADQAHSVRRSESVFGSDRRSLDRRVLRRIGTPCAAFSRTAAISWTRPSPTYWTPPSPRRCAPITRPSSRARAAGPDGPLLHRVRCASIADPAVSSWRQAGTSGRAGRPQPRLLASTPIPSTHRPARSLRLARGSPRTGCRSACRSLVALSASSTWCGGCGDRADEPQPYSSAARRTVRSGRGGRMPIDFQARLFSALLLRLRITRRLSLTAGADPSDALDTRSDCGAFETSTPTHVDVRLGEAAEAADGPRRRGARGPLPASNSG